MVITQLILLSALSCAVCCFLTRCVRTIAIRTKLTDHPDGYRKLHANSTPLGGGVAILLATVAVLGPLALLPNPWYAYLHEASRELWAILGAAIVIVMLGLVDDRAGIRGRYKLAGQVVAIGILILSGIRVQQLGVLGQQYELGMLAVPFTLVWMLGAVNSINLLDGLDGFATLIGVILASTLAVIAMMSGHQDVALVSAVFSGSLLGFLWFNLPPARIFLGDAGSMLIGLVIGVSAILGSMKGAGTVLLAAPLAVWTIPFFDSAAAILRRKLAGRSIYTTDRGHLHHQLLQRLGNNHRVLGVVMLCCATTSTAALVGVFLKNDLIGLLVAVSVIIIFVASGLFGRAEFLMLLGHLRRFGRGLRANGEATAQAAQGVVRLQGSAQWGKLWSALTESAAKLSIRQMHLDVNAPLIHEGYSATWEKPCLDGAVCRHGCWRVELPLMVGSESIGRLRVKGCADNQSKHADIELLLHILESHESYLKSIVETAIAAQPAHGNGAKKKEAVPRKAAITS